MRLSELRIENFRSCATSQFPSMTIPASLVRTAGKIDLSRHSTFFSGIKRIPDPVLQLTEEICVERTRQRLRLPRHSMTCPCEQKILRRIFDWADSLSREGKTWINRISAPIKTIRRENGNARLARVELLAAGARRPELKDDIQQFFQTSGGRKRLQKNRNGYRSSNV